jgi:hypothetical protein
MASLVSPQSPSCSNITKSGQLHCCRSRSMFRFTRCYPANTNASTGAAPPTTRSRVSRLSLRTTSHRPLATTVSARTQRSKFAWRSRRMALSTRSSKASMQTLPKSLNAMAETSSTPKATRWILLPQVEPAVVSQIVRGAVPKSPKGS